MVLAEGAQAGARGGGHTSAPERSAGPPTRGLPSPEQPEAAAIYRGSHAQSLLAAATAEYFAQIWLEPKRGGREPREPEGDPRRVKSLPGRGAGAGAGGEGESAGEGD